ncbi:MAG: LptE family protein [Vicingaceae bacterium]
MTLHRYSVLSAMFLLAFFLPVNSCRYSFTGASISPEVKTISVDFFKSYAPIAPPILEQTFTEALKEIFVSQTNLRLVESGGDLHFEGRITGYQTAPIAVSTNQTASQERLTITVRVKFTNEKEPKNDFDRAFSRFQDYDATQNIQSIENDLILDINQQLVQNIFDAAVSNW